MPTHARVFDRATLARDVCMCVCAFTSYCLLNHSSNNERVSTQETGIIMFVARLMSVTTCWALGARVIYLLPASFCHVFLHRHGMRRFSRR